MALLLRLGVGLAWESSPAMAGVLFGLVLIQSALPPLQLFLTGITINGVPFAGHNLTALRNRITVVYQDAARFAFALEDNIAIGDPGFSWGDPDTGRVSSGRITEVGSHDELVASGGVYADLFAVQASRYRATPEE